METAATNYIKSSNKLIKTTTNRESIDVTTKKVTNEVDICNKRHSNCSCSKRSNNSSNNRCNNSYRLEPITVIAAKKILMYPLL